MQKRCQTDVQYMLNRCTTEMQIRYSQKTDAHNRCITDAKQMLNICTTDAKTHE